MTPQPTDNNKFKEQLNLLFNHPATEHTYTNEQLAELHLQTIGYLFHLEHSLPQEEEFKYYLNRCRWTLNIDPLNSSLHHEVCLLLMQWMTKQAYNIKHLTS